MPSKIVLKETGVINPSRFLDIGFSSQELSLHIHVSAQSFAFWGCTVVNYHEDTRLRGKVPTMLSLLPGYPIQIEIFIEPAKNWRIPRLSIWAYCSDSDIDIFV
jgi:hypothetical protein